MDLVRGLSSHVVNILESSRSVRCRAGSCNWSLRVTLSSVCVGWRILQRLFYCLLSWVHSMPLNLSHCILPSQMQPPSRSFPIYLNLHGGFYVSLSIPLSSHDKTTPALFSSRCQQGSSHRLSFKMSAFPYRFWYGLICLYIIRNYIN